jgi:hypothetical protein
MLILKVRIRILGSGKIKKKNKYRSGALVGGGRRISFSARGKGCMFFGLNLCVWQVLVEMGTMRVLYLHICYVSME